MNVYFLAVLLILLGGYLLDLVADLLNVRHLRVDLPEEFAGVYDQERYRKSQEYLRVNTGVALIEETVMTPLVIAFVVLGGFNCIDRMVRGFHPGEITAGLLFAGSLMLLSQLCRIPFSIYRTFVVEERYGFNKTTPRIFVTDLLKKLLLIAFLGGIALSMVLWLFGRFGSLGWIYCWAAVSVLQILLTLIAPAVIMPLFNKFTPLQDGDLKAAIERYAGSQNFVLKGIFTMDASRRSTKSNAFFTGFGRYRRVALFDTLIVRHPQEEIIAILAHEIGHYKKRHHLKSVITIMLATGLMFAMLPLFINNRALFDAFRMEQLSLYASIFFFGFLYIPVQTVIGILLNMLSRRHEYEADAYAARTCGRPESMIAALKKLSIDNLSNLTPHPFKVFLDYSHPPVLRRIRALTSPPSGSARQS
ncbi:MAG: M48 family metallopeptidase [Candidatus Aureabacteria bacterium]|nr:M48 family metallopeptidase [Candidatus Auribacterota bacterium]